MEVSYLDETKRDVVDSVMEEIRIMLGVKTLVEILHIEKPILLKKNEAGEVEVYYEGSLIAKAKS